MKPTKKVLMPKGTALWLKMNTNLTFNQIKEFCDLDFFTLSSLNESNTIPHDPIELGQLTLEEIQKSEQNPERNLTSTLDPYYLYTKKAIKKITEAQKLQYIQIITWFYYNFKFVSAEAMSKFLDIKLSFVNKTIKFISNTNEYLESKSPVDYHLCTKLKLDDFIAIQKTMFDNKNQTNN